jgi:DNA-binding beta-propeller fold protein YncE
LGGSGLNRIAILDPGAAGTDPVTGVSVMQEVLSAAGPTPDGPPPMVKEWCVNSVAVDPAGKAVFVNNEDGKLYRWDLATNTLAQAIVLTAGLGEAYTPTAIGVDGTVYAIANATLFAVGE